MMLVMVVMSAGGVASQLCTTLSRGLAAEGGTSPDTRYFPSKNQNCTCIIVSSDTTYDVAISLCSCS